MIKSEKIKKLEKNKIYAVVREQDPQKALSISQALIEGGLKTIEITTDCNDSCGVICKLAQIEDIMVGAGSIITSQQALLGIQSGAQFLVTPVLEMSLVKFCKARALPLITGASTANEAYESWKINNSITKIFPAKAMGGPEYIKDILKAMPFLKLMPTSGIKTDDFIDYLKAGAVAVGMGKAFYENADNYSAITAKAKDVINKLNDYFWNE